MTTDQPPRVLRIEYLIPNQAWAVVFGDSLISIGPTERRMWEKRHELEDALAELNLRVDRNGIIT